MDPLMSASSPSRPPAAPAVRRAAFVPAPGQRVWVRDRIAAVRGVRQWVHFVRVDKVEWVSAGDNWDGSPHCEHVGSRSRWQCPCVGASFPNMRAAAAWVASLPQ